jgi:uroporphyrin-III C-methyltransferase/precorrin-2 dehydrogenase/sirohydrochlorin ferrochelatase
MTRAWEVHNLPGFCVSRLLMSQLLPLFVDLAGRRVLLVGAGPVAAAKLGQLRAGGADVRVIAPDVCEEIERTGVPVERRAFEAVDLDGVWLVVAAATPAANREVAAAAEARRVFVNAVDDPANATAFLSGVVRRDGVTLAISTSGSAPGLTALLREGLDALLPRDLGAWLDEARRQRAAWRGEGVPMSERRPLLLEALNRLYDRSPEGPRRAHGGEGVRQGHVSLVGAGPGDPGLLTRHAVVRLRAADLVLYDALIDRRILKLARHAQRFFVGKRAGRHAMTQPTINSVMIRAARRGKRVVRLKGGDPFVFGRGGEEALALRAAGVSFDVVPGVTSAIAAPALAGIPVTYRGVSSAFLVVGGHDEETFDAALNGIAPHAVTLVVLMGVGRRVQLANRLIARGWPRQTPAAIVVEASRPTQTVWTGTLDDLTAEQLDVDDKGPGTIVIGEVVALATLESHGSEKREHHGSR